MLTLAQRVRVTAPGKPASHVLEHGIHAVKGAQRHKRLSTARQKMQRMLARQNSRRMRFGEANVVTLINPNAQQAGRRTGSETMRGNLWTANVKSSKISSETVVDSWRGANQPMPTSGGQASVAALSGKWLKSARKSMEDKD